MTLTPEKLDELERLAELATPGPYSCVNGETITLRAPDGSCLAQMTFLTKRGRRDADEVAKTARMLATLDPATVRELVLAAKERQWQPIETSPHETLVVLGWREANGAWKQEIAMASAGLRHLHNAPDIWRHPAATHWVPLPEPPEVPHD